jgi:hypothetical protein
MGNTAIGTRLKQFFVNVAHMKQKTAFITCSPCGSIYEAITTKKITCLANGKQQQHTSHM